MLADIERGFRVLKSEIKIAPLFHRLLDRIRAHALICFMALVLYRVMRMQLKAAGSPYSPERAVEIARPSICTRCASPARVRQQLDRTDPRT
ncbi:transposase, IS4 family protein, partial [mine drainage metagenome]